MASSAHGSPRATNDVDLVVDLRTEHVAPLCAALGDTFYAPAERLHEAIARRSCANLLHLATGYKVDVFGCRATEYDRLALSRFVERSLEPGTRPFHVATAEDILLRKLEWYRSGGEVSDRQWNDVLGILRLRERDLDRAYLERWAARLGLHGLLARAQREAGDRH
ncbi:MAG: hypothetical protein KF830_12910 [Planctomycetes bacterium]|nr:hypothetical protein [Planctomycetota bacterium]